MMSARMCRRACYEIASCDCAQDVVKQLSALDAARYAVVPKNQTAGFLADNVSDEMARALRDSLEECPPDKWLPAIGYAKAISAALRAAAGSAPTPPEVK